MILDGQFADRFLTTAATGKCLVQMSDSGKVSSRQPSQVYL